MKKINLNVSVSLKKEYDIIIAGGGPSGCTAGAASSREGKKVLLIEGTGALGGMATMGLVTCWAPFSDKKKIIYQGLAEKIFIQSKKATPHVNMDDLDWVPFDPEKLKVIYDDLLIKNKVDVLFNSFVCGVAKDKEDHISEIIVSNKSGLTAYRAKIFIDCTGDADLAVWAGVPYEKGDDNNTMQPVSHCFVLSNVDSLAYQTEPELHPYNKKSPVYEIAKDKEFPLIRDVHICQNFIGPSTVGFNSGHVWDVDGTNPENFSKALMKGRKLAHQFRDSLAKYQPKAFANSFLVNTAPLLGIRETRRIIGDYILTIEDYLKRKSFKDEIARNAYFIDIHTAKDEIKNVLNKELVWHRHQNYKPGESHGIPYRCLVPKGIKNLLVAGRSISTDRTVQGSTRTMPVCLVLGEAVGVAASMAVASGDVRKVNVDKLRAKLKKYGNYLP